MQVIEVRWFVVSHVRFAEARIDNLAEDQCRRCSALGHARIAIRELVIIRANDNATAREHLPCRLGYLGQVPTVKRHHDRVTRCLVD